MAQPGRAPAGELAQGSTEGPATSTDFDVAGIIEGFVPGWSLGSARPSAWAAPGAPTGGETALVPHAGGEEEGSRPSARDEAGVEADYLPLRPVVEVEGIVPDWVRQVRPGAYIVFDSHACCSVL